MCLREIIHSVRCAFVYCPDEDVGKAPPHADESLGLAIEIRSRLDVVLQRLSEDGDAEFIQQALTDQLHRVKNGEEHDA